MQASIFRRFTLLSVLIGFATLVPLIGFGFYAIHLVSDHLIRITVEDLKRDVLVDANKIRHVLETAQDDLPILIQLPAIRELVRAKAGANQIEIASARPAVEQVLLAFSTNRKIYDQIRYIDEHGREVIRVDHDGRHPPRLIPWSELQDTPDRTYFSETMKLEPGRIYTSRMDLNREHGRIEVPHRLVIRYATPLFDDAGHRRGIIVINLRAASFLQPLYEATKAAQMSAHILDADGFYLFHSNAKKQWGGPGDLNTGERIQRDLPALADRLLSGDPVSTVTGEMVTTSQPIMLSAHRSGSFIVLVEQVPTSLVLAALSDLRLYLLIVLVGVGVSGLAGAVLMGERLTGPIVALEKAAHRIRQGDLEARVDARGSREIVALGEAFNVMTESLSQARGQIDRQLRELTAINLIGTAVSGTLSLNEVLDRALDATLDGLGVDAGEIFLLDEERGEVVFARHRGLAPEAFQQISRFKLGDGFPGLVALSGEVLMTTDLPNDPRFLRNQVTEADFNTFAAIPLKAAGKVIGTINVAVRASHAFLNGEFPLLTTIGATIGMAVSNARLYETQRVTADQLTAKIEELERIQSRLIEAERLRAMGQMAAGVAHDFNNALMGMLGQVQLIRNVLVRESAKTALRRAEGDAAILDYLARQERVILDASETIRKIREATRQKNVEAFAPVALKEVVTEVLAITQPRWKDQAEAAGVRMTIRTALAETPPVLGQASELREALTNLLFNALDAMPQGGTVTIATQQVDEQWVELTVTDTGVGMSPTVQAHLFEPFYTTKGVRGTGLGLSMVFGIVRRHDGEVTVRSKEGLGTTITLRLPVASASVAQVGSPSPTLCSPIAPLTCLVIDDEPLLAETLGEILRSLGHEATIAFSGDDGLRRVAAERFDLVLTDLGMPEISGWEVARKIKASWPDMPVILVTGWGDSVEREQLEGAEVDLILAKPYTVAQLTRTLAEAAALIRRDSG